MLKKGVGWILLLLAFVSLMGEIPAQAQAPDPTDTVPLTITPTPEPTQPGRIAPGPPWVVRLMAKTRALKS